LAGGGLGAADGLGAAVRAGGAADGAVFGEAVGGGVTLAGGGAIDDGAGPAEGGGSAWSVTESGGATEGRARVPGSSAGLALPARHQVTLTLASTQASRASAKVGSEIRRLGGDHTRVGRALSSLSFSSAARVSAVIGSGVIGPTTGGERRASKGASARGTVGACRPSWVRSSTGRRTVPIGPLRRTASGSLDARGEGG
jgi:hypothetical protein